ncbi:MAG TPA: hypothetical protein VF185_03255 [Patescibacteria group bacterium]
MDVTSQIFLYGLALAVITLTLTIFYLISLYRDLVKKLANVKAGEKIKVKADLDQTTKRVIDAVTDEVQKKMETQFSSIIAGSKTNLEKDIASIVSEVRTKLTSDVSGIGQTLKEEVVSADTAAKKVLEEEHDKVKLELAEFKKKQMDEIVAKAKIILPQVLKDVVVKSMDPKTQEDLIINSLENAKRQNNI